MDKIKKTLLITLCVIWWLIPSGASILLQTYVDYTLAVIVGMLIGILFGFNFTRFKWWLKYKLNIY